jgi:hypothetical protein
MIPQNGHTSSLAILGHTFSVSAIISAVLGWLPTGIGIIGASLAMVWYLIQIYESRTFGAWVMARRLKRRARLDAKKTIAEALTQSQVVLSKARLEANEKLRVVQTEANELIQAAKYDASTLIAAERTAAIELVAEQKAEASTIIPPFIDHKK